MKEKGGPFFTHQHHKTSHVCGYEAWAAVAYSPSKFAIVLNAE
jgi:hypothetical protein